MTTTEAAERLGVSPARVRQLVADGTLPAQKFGPVNLVKESDLDLARNRPGLGRPPKAQAEAEQARPKLGKASGPDGRVVITKKGGKKR